MTYKFGEFHFEYVYPVQSVDRQQKELISSGRFTVDPYRSAAFSHCMSSVSAKPTDICVLMCEDRIGKGEPKRKKHVCVAFEVWWV